MKVLLSVLLLAFVGNGAVAYELMRKDFFKDIVGIEEEDFRLRYGWDQTHYLNPASESVRRDLYALNPRSAAIFQGSFSWYRIDTLDALVAAMPNVVLAKPSFTIALFDPVYPEQSNIRAYQADPSFNGAVFQIDSTFWGPLERGIYHPDARLAAMLNNPGKAEEASIATAPATIYRKYCMPHYPDPATDKRYLLQNLFAVLPYVIDPVSKQYTIDPQAVVQYQPHDDHAGALMVGVHQDVVVSSGFGRGTRPTDTQPALPIVLTQDGLVDQARTQLITQVFTAAYYTRDLRYNPLTKRYDQPLPPSAVAVACLLLNASYQAPCKVALILKQPHVVMTLIGARAAYNEMPWIAQALQGLERFIIDHGMRVTLIYRADAYRPVGKLRLRTKEVDTAFLKTIIAMASRINHTPLPPDALVARYVHEAYDVEERVACGYDANPDAMSAAAKALQVYCSGSL